MWCVFLCGTLFYLSTLWVMTQVGSDQLTRNITHIPELHNEAGAHIMISGVKEHVQVENISTDRDQKRVQKCKGVYFWGSGKSGSTTLAAMLKHDYSGNAWDSTSQFVDLEKELCWASGRGASHQKVWQDIVCSGIHRFALDACPRYRYSYEAERIIQQDPDAKFLFLVRSPIERLISHLNDDIRRGGRRFDVDTEALRLVNSSDIRWMLSQYGLVLANLLRVIKYPARVLVIQTDAMKQNPQQVLDDVTHFISADRKNTSNIHQNYASGMNSYKHVSNKTERIIQESLTTDLLLLENLVGKTFPWSWTKQFPILSSSWTTSSPRYSGGTRAS